MLDPYLVICIRIRIGFRAHIPLLLLHPHAAGRQLPDDAGPGGFGPTVITTDPLLGLAIANIVSGLSPLQPSSLGLPFP